MITDIKGYCTLKSLDSVFIGLNPITQKKEIEELKSKLTRMILPIHDIGVDNSGFLCIISNPACLIDIRDMKDVSHYFYCFKYMDVILPPEMENDLVQATAQAIKRLTRKGGYNQLVRRMVVAASLHKGKVCDDFLFQKS